MYNTSSTAALSIPIWELLLFLDSSCVSNDIILSALWIVLCEDTAKPCFIWAVHNQFFFFRIIVHNNWLIYEHSKIALNDCLKSRVQLMHSFLLSSIVVRQLEWNWSWSYQVRSKLRISTFLLYCDAMFCSFVGKIGDVRQSEIPSAAALMAKVSCLELHSLQVWKVVIGLEAGFNWNCIHPCFMSSLMKCLALFSLYHSSSVLESVTFAVHDNVCGYHNIFVHSDLHHIQFQCEHQVAYLVSLSKILGIVSPFPLLVPPKKFDIIMLTK